LSESEGGVLTETGTLEKLYGRIADAIGSSVPDVDFEAYAAEFKNLEKELAKLAEKRDPSINVMSRSADGSDFEMIKDPHVLCVTSQQFRELGYENQLQMVLDAFPSNIRHQIVISSAELKRILLNERVDIIHIAAFVCPRAGDLYFSPVELPLGKGDSPDVDLLSPDILVVLLERAKTRLVVLGASASLVLAAQLVTVTNVIAARDMVSARAMASWVETFYQNITRETLVAASKLASEVSQAPMRLYAQQRQAPAMTVELSRS
jgi:hypothetical protein